MQSLLGLSTPSAGVFAGTAALLAGHFWFAAGLCLLSLAVYTYVERHANLQR